MIPARSLSPWLASRYAAWRFARAEACLQDDDDAAAAAHYRAAAGCGHVEAHFRLYRCYTAGKGVLANPADALSWCRRAAEAGHPDARFELSLIHLHGRHSRYEGWFHRARSREAATAETNRRVLFPNGLSVSQDYREAYRWGLVEAQQGRPEAMANIGIQHLHGLGCERDYALARHWLKQAAEAGSAQAQNALGLMCQHGLGMEVDLPLAMTCYKAAALQNEPNALLALALLHLQGGTGAAPAPAAIPLLERAAGLGNIEASYQLGALRLEGKGGAPDYLAAEGWLRRAAYRGHGAAMLRLAQAYERGLGRAPNLDNAIMWYRAAADRGDPEAQYKLGTALATDRSTARLREEGLRRLSAAAEAGHILAREALNWPHADDDRALGIAAPIDNPLLLAWRLLTGEGRAQDETGAVSWFRKAADRGDRGAQVQLAILYREGRGTARNLDIAAQWFLRAAEGGDALAQRNMAAMFYCGAGIGKDRDKAAYWFNEAAKSGLDEVDSMLKSLEATVDTTEKNILSDDADTMHWQLAAADTGDVAAQVVVAWNYLLGRGCGQNDAAALRWFRLAAEGGDVGAQTQLATMLREGRGIASDEAGALTWYRRAADLGDGQAQYELAIMLSGGKAGGELHHEAVQWSAKAAAAGVAEAEILLSRLQGSEKPEDAVFPLEDLIAARRHLMGAEAGNAEMQMLLGWDYLLGRGIAQDDEAAARWFLRSAEAGNKAAQSQLANLFTEGRGVSRDLDAAADWARRAANMGGEVFSTPAVLSLPRRKRSDTTKTLVSTMKNEGPFILEWLAFHRAIGFDEFVIASNDCDDKSDALLDVLALEGVISHRRNPIRPDEDPQYVFLQKLIDHPTLKRSDWIMAMDADEFLNIGCGDGHLDDLLSGCPDADAISILWKTFGDCGIPEWQGGLTLEQFDRCEDTIDEWNRFHKTIFRNNGKFGDLDAHYPCLAPGVRLEEVNICNAAYQRYDASFLQTYWPSIRDLQRDKSLWTWENACVHHYPYKTPDLFALKRYRGDNVPGRGDEKYEKGSAYYWLRAKNSVTDRSILRMLPDTRRELQQLRESHLIRQAEGEMLEAFDVLRNRVLNR